MALPPWRREGRPFLTNIKSPNVRTSDGVPPFLFDLRHPEFQVNHIQWGDLVYIHVCMYTNGRFLEVTLLTSAGYGSPLAPLVVGHAAGLRVHHGASVAPANSPWRVFWASSVAKLA